MLLSLCKPVRFYRFCTLKPYTFTTYCSTVETSAGLTRVITIALSKPLSEFLESAFNLESESTYVVVVVVVVVQAFAKRCSLA